MKNKRQKLDYSFSIKGRTIEASAAKDGEIRFNLNIMEDKHDLRTQYNPLNKIFDFDFWLQSFITYFCAVELHEIGHTYNFKTGCSRLNHMCPDTCPWCQEVEKIYYWLLPEVMK